jgi:hypothetical protein
MVVINGVAKQQDLDAVRELSPSEIRRVRVIKNWAHRNYEKGGSFIIECFSDEEIVDSFRNLFEAKSYARHVLRCEAEALSLVY